MLQHIFCRRIYQPKCGYGKRDHLEASRRSAIPRINGNLFSRPARNICGRQSNLNIARASFMRITTTSPVSKDREKLLWKFFKISPWARSGYINLILMHCIVNYSTRLQEDEDIAPALRTHGFPGLFPLLGTALVVVVVDLMSFRWIYRYFIDIIIRFDNGISRNHLVLNIQTIPTIGGT